MRSGFPTPKRRRSSIRSTKRCLRCELAVLTRFVPSVAPAREAVGGEPAAIDDVRCVVRARGAGGIRELVIGTDAHGDVIVTGDRGRLGQRARGELAFHETASG